MGCFPCLFDDVNFSSDPNQYDHGDLHTVTLGLSAMIRQSLEQRGFRVLV